MEFRDVLEAAIKKAGGVTNLAKALKVSRPIIYTWRKTMPGRKNEQKVYEYAGIPMPGVVNLSQLGQSVATRVPLIDQINTGRGGVAVDPYAPGAAEDYFTVFTKVSDATFALKLRGDSMEPVYYDGEVVVIDPAVYPENEDDIAVELLGATQEPGEGNWTFKRYRPRGTLNGFQAFDLVPLNPKYPTISITKPGLCRFIGTMVVHQRNRRR